MSAQTAALASAVSAYGSATPTLFNVLTYLDDVMTTLDAAVADVAGRITSGGGGSLPSAASWQYATDAYSSEPDRTLFDVLDRIAFVVGTTGDAIMDMSDAIDSIDGLGPVPNAETLEDAAMTYLGVPRTLFNMLSALAIYVAALSPALSQMDTRINGITSGLTVSVSDNGSATDGADDGTGGGDNWYLRPYKSTSPWNTLIPGNATYYGPGDARTDMIRLENKPNLPGWESAGAIVWAVNAQNFAVNEYFASPGDPPKTVRVKDMYGSRFDYNVTVPWPAGTHSAMGTDMHLAIRDADGVTSHDFWHFDESTNPPTAASYSRTRLDGTGWFLYPYALESPSNPHGRNPDESIAGVGAARAVSVGLLGGLITKADVDKGVIDHVIALAVPRTYIRRGPRVWPADPTSSYYDGDARSTGPLAYSMLVAIPKSVNLNALGLSAEWLMVAKAMQDYGLRIVDVGGVYNPCIYTSYPSAFTFGTALRDRQGVDFPKLWKVLQYVELP